MTSPRLSIDTPRGRMYALEPGGAPLYPSITTVAGMRAKDHLQGWYATMASKRALEMFDYLRRNPDRASEEIRRVTSSKWGTQKKIAAAAEDYTRRASDFGTYVHALCEDWERSGSRPTRQDMSDKAAQLRADAGALAQERSLDDLLTRADQRLDGFGSFLEDFQPEFVEVEQTVVNHEVGYAGTTDAIVKIGNSLLSADIKTSKKVRGDYALQGVAVVNAEQLLDDDGSVRPMPDLVGACVIHLPEAGGYSVVPLRTGDAEFAVFRALKQAWLFEAEECISTPSTTPQQLLLSLLRAKGGLDALGSLAAPGSRSTSPGRAAAPLEEVAPLGDHSASDPAAHAPQEVGAGAPRAAAEDDAAPAADGAVPAADAAATARDAGLPRTAEAAPHAADPAPHAGDALQPRF